ncbi:unnamed protein product [Meganyctiphanes norvegica]|uniref:Fibrinogen C-terminal domain-containing protein n=1 Tax=Meganyctiphanes norvegica TaxID=48144 RepID=A0AAV2SWK0_MEGNR
MWVTRITCIALVLGRIPSIRTAQSGQGELKQGPRNCAEVYLAGGQVEGYYAVFPNSSNPGEIGLVYCNDGDGMLPHNTSAPRTNPQNCQDLKDNGMHESGVNVIYPWLEHPESPVIVYCNQDVMGGGWTVFQRRDDYPTQLDFYRSFEEYSLGFGQVGTEFWLGNDLLHELTEPSVSELYVELTSFAGVTKYALYSSFYVGPKEPANPGIGPYQLSVAYYSGNAGDSLTYHTGMAFSTFDLDNDLYTANCAESNHGGWWYKDCYDSNLNGFYFEDGRSDITSANWKYFPAKYVSLQRIQMMTRPAQCN